MADTQHNTTGVAQTAGEIISAIPIPQGGAPSSSTDAERQAHSQVTDSPQGHPSTTNETVQHAPIAPSPSPRNPASPVGSSPPSSHLASQTTRTGASSYNEKQLKVEKSESVADDKKDKKKSKSKKEPKDKRTPFEIAMENPELANLREDHRIAIAEQM